MPKVPSKNVPVFWRDGQDASNHSESFYCTNGELFSYGDLIGFTSVVDRKRYLWKSSGISKTTSKHMNFASKYAHYIITDLAEFNNLCEILG